MKYSLIKSKEHTTSTIGQILLNRGFKDEKEIFKYLNPTEDDILQPTGLKNIQLGARLLIYHIYKNNKIWIQVDSDADGFCSAAILINYLYKLFPTYVQTNISYRLHDGKQHGVIVDTVPEDVKLVILPDSGSNQYEEHRTLKNKGIDVLVLDHHEAEKESEDAIVINNQICDYKNKTLCGAGIVYKFCQYLDSLLEKNYSEEFIDLCAFALISDMMDMRDFETHKLIIDGLENFNNKLLLKLVEANEFSIRNTLTPISVSFYLTPCINAMIRSGSQEEKLILFESMIDFKSETLIPSTKRGCKGEKETLVEQACRTCLNVKKRQAKDRDSNEKILDDLIVSGSLLNNKILVIRVPKESEINKNLVGLCANQIMDEYKRPTLILNETYQVDKETGEATLIWQGSARGLAQSELTDLKSLIHETGLAEYEEGHAQAFGVGILDNNIDKFLSVTNEKLKDMDFSKCYNVDFIYDMSNLDPDFVLTIANWKHLWGQGLPEPLIAIENLTISNANISLMSPTKNPTLKITLPNNINLIKFKSSEEEFKNLQPKTGEIVKIVAIGKCEINEWNGNITPQIIIQDYEIKNHMFDF